MIWAALGIAFLFLLASRVNLEEDVLGPDIVELIARAIAKAEGFFAAGSLPARNHNPGDLKTHDGSLAVFSSDEAGWSALRGQINKILNDQSRFYNSRMSIAQIAEIWTGGDNPEAWAAIVADELGVTTDSNLTEVTA